MRSTGATPADGTIIVPWAAKSVALVKDDLSFSGVDHQGRSGIAVAIGILTEIRVARVVWKRVLQGVRRLRKF